MEGVRAPSVLSLSRPALRNTGLICSLHCKEGTPLLYGEMRFNSAASFAAKGGSFLCRSGGMGTTRTWSDKEFCKAVETSKSVAVRIAK